MNAKIDNMINTSMVPVMPIPSQAAEGNGSAEGVETKPVSPNNNPAPERPAPARVGEDIVRSREETPGVTTQVVATVAVGVRCSDHLSPTKSRKRPKYDQSHLDVVRRYRTEGMSHYAIARITGITLPTILAWLRGERSPSAVAKKEGRLGAPRLKLKPGWERLTIYKAYILGVLAGDGHLHPGTKSFVLDVRDRDFSEATQRAFSDVFGLNGKIYERDRPGRARTFTFMASSVNAYDDLKRYIASGNKTKTWRVPPEIFSSVDVAAAFLRGFADSEGSVCDQRRAGRAVRLFGINELGMDDIQRLLALLKINSKKIRCRTHFEVKVSGYPNIALFARLIGFSIERKRVRLDTMVVHWEDSNHGTSKNRNNSSPKEGFHE